MIILTVTIQKTIAKGKKLYKTSFSIQVEQSLLLPSLVSKSIFNREDKSTLQKQPTKP